MQTSSPSSTKPDFERASKLSRENAVEHRMALIKSRQIKKEYAALKARQEGALEFRKQQLEKAYDGAVEAMTQVKLRERLDSISLDLKPINLPGPDLKSQTEAARRDAVVEVEMSIDQTIKDMKQGFLEPRERFAEQAELRQSRMSEFNRNASDRSKTQDRQSSGQSKGQSR